MDELATLKLIVAALVDMSDGGELVIHRDVLQNVDPAKSLKVEPHWDDPTPHLTVSVIR